MGEKVINAALLGLGTVGTGVYKVLKNQEEEMTAKIGCKVKIRKILVRNLEKAAGKVDDPAASTRSAPAFACGKTGSYHFSFQSPVPPGSAVSA